MEFIQILGVGTTRPGLDPYVTFVVGTIFLKYISRNYENEAEKCEVGAKFLKILYSFLKSYEIHPNDFSENKKENSPTGYHSLNRTINPMEVEGLSSVLSIIKAVANFDENARIALCEHPNWAPIQVLLGLLGCSVPILLKAEILLTLTALGKSRETAAQIWANLENSQIISTIPSTNTFNSEASLSEEIETNESRNGIYPVSKAVLELLYTLTSVGVPRTLGVGTRRPGLDPYVTFVVGTIFLKFISRNYENEAEKWEVGAKCLKILYSFLKSYEIHPNDFSENKEENSPPGYHVMIQVHTKSDILKLILEIIYQTKEQLDTYDSFIPGKTYLEECSLYCLQIIETALSNQDLSQNTDENVELELKIAIIELLKDSLHQPAPNITHYLLGFDITKDIRSTQLQKPGVLDFPSTCAKSLVSLLDFNIEMMKSQIDFDSRYEQFIEKAYELLY
uniref:Uncharacterized protein n=1 Tax=Megaselia scalaris TaxID=36166 RepID=T1GBX3_MEGSC